MTVLVQCAKRGDVKTPQGATVSGEADGQNGRRIRTTKQQSLLMSDGTDLGVGEGANRCSIGVAGPHCLKPRGRPRGGSLAAFSSRSLQGASAVKTAPLHWRYGHLYTALLTFWQPKFIVHFVRPLWLQGTVVEADQMSTVAANMLPPAIQSSRQILAAAQARLSPPIGRVLKLLHRSSRRCDGQLQS